MLVPSMSGDEMEVAVAGESREREVQERHGAGKEETRDRCRLIVRPQERPGEK